MADPVVPGRSMGAGVRVVQDRRLDIHIVFNGTMQCWHAYEDGYEPGARYGTGETPAAAVVDLVEQMDEAGEFDAEDWPCHRCGHVNVPENTACSACGAERRWK